MKIDNAKLKKILLKENYLTEGDFKKAETEAERKNLFLTDYLLGSGLITKDLLGQAIAESFQVPYADLNSNQPPPSRLGKFQRTLPKNSERFFSPATRKKPLLQQITLLTKNCPKRWQQFFLKAK